MAVVDRLLAAARPIWDRYNEHPFVKGYDRGFFEVKDKRFSKKKRYDPDPWWNVLYTGIFGPLPPKIDEQYQKIKRARQDGLLIDIRRRNKGEKDEIEA